MSTVHGTRTTGRMRTPARRRRRFTWVKTFFLVLLLAGVVALFRATGNAERVTTLWVGAEVRTDGSMRVTEVIDYDFGSPDTTRHGIYRDIPDLSEDTAKVAVTMDGHRVPWEFDVGDYYQKPDGQRELAERIKVGDPDGSVTGLHRYRVQYTLTDVVKRGKIAWDAVGTGWQVDRANVDIHVVAPYRLTPTRCVHGSNGSEDPCTARATGPGGIDIALDRLTGHEGVTLYATNGAELTGGGPALPAAPSGAAVGTSAHGSFWLASLAFVLTLGLAIGTVLALKFLGRDRIVRESPDGTPGRVRRVSLERLAARLTPSSVPPEGITPAQGGILLAERVEKHHQVAWLFGLAADGHLTITGDPQRPWLIRRERTAPADDPLVDSLLDGIFGGRTAFMLGTRDQVFTSGWQRLSRELFDWQRTSDLWDGRTTRLAEIARTAGIVATPLGFVLAAVGAYLLGGRHSSGWYVLLPGLLAVGAGFALWLRSWELRSRSPRGSELWLRVEAFRRHLADPSARREPADPDDGHLAVHTAWAVALGMADEWQHIAEPQTATAGGSSRTSNFLPGYALGLITASSLSSAPPPSSSSSSGGGGGGGGFGGGSDVGGGDGGGGGGSW